jgi:hypothetical protein
MSSAIGMVIAAPAAAAPFKFKPLVDTRLRYEHVEQAGLTEDAEAVTIRARLGGELSNGPWSFLAEAEGTLAINEDYNSGVNGKALFPIVADPENIELNRIQVQYKGLPKTVVTSAASASISMISVSSAASAGARTSRPSMRRASNGRASRTSRSI